MIMESIVVDHECTKMELLECEKEMREVVMELSEQLCGVVDESRVYIEQ